VFQYSGGKYPKVMAQQVNGLTSSDPGPRFEQCVDDALAILREAADEWALGHPERPPAREVLERILRTFEHEHFLRRGLGKIG
jgi:hypothetical protein